MGRGISWLHNEYFMSLFTISSQPTGPTVKLKWIIWKQISQMSNSTLKIRFLCSSCSVPLWLLHSKWSHLFHWNKQSGQPATVWKHSTWSTSNRKDKNKLCSLIKTDFFQSESKCFEIVTWVSNLYLITFHENLFWNICVFCEI